MLHLPPRPASPPPFRPSSPPPEFPLNRPALVGNSNEGALRALWLAVTVRVAWDLVAARIRVRPRLLADAREHVLRSLPEDITPEEAEEWASVHVREYVERVRARAYARPGADPDRSIPIARAWREELVGALDHIGDTVLRMHYGDGMPIEAVEAHAAVDRLVLAAARDGVREAMRAIASSGGLDVSEWTDARLDRLISRVAAVSGPVCPGPVGLLTDAGRNHADRCPRCSRSVRLIGQGVLAPSDLFPPDGQPAVPPGRIRLLVIVLHPDARACRPSLARALGTAGTPIAGDAWMLPADELSRIGPALRESAREARPPRHHLRGAVVEGPGRWSRSVVLGPLPLAALEGARRRPWSEVDLLGERPAPLPPPPRATRLWLVATACGLAAAVAGIATFAPRMQAPACPVEATFQVDGEELVARFDVEDLAVVDVVALDAGGLHVYDGGSRESKGRWATGQGDFRIRAPARALAIVSSPTGIAGLDALTAAAAADPDPLDSLVRRVHAAEPRADVVRSPL